MSMGGGKSSGSGTTQVESEASKTLAKMATRFEKESRGSRTGLLSAMEEVLKTGGSSIPIISRSVEQSRRAGSKALSDTDERLALMGLAGTPEGERIRSGTQLESEITAGQTEQALAQNIFGMISNFVLGQSQTATGGLAGAIPGMSTTKEDATGKSAGLRI